MTHPRPIAILPAALIAVVLAACDATAPTSAPGATATPAPATTAVTPPTVTPAAPSTVPAPTKVDCTAPAATTISQTEGPYFKAGSPERSVLAEAGIAGAPLTYTGFVVDTSCRPIAGAVVDIWQADGNGAYDNAGYDLRGHVATDANGSFTFETVIPGQYPGRTEHIHVKVTPPGGATLTTQMYFPGSAANSSDGIFDASLILDLAQAGDAYLGTFTFVLPAG